MAEIFKIWNTYIGPAATAGSDLGSDSFKWNNLYLDGVAYLDGIVMAGNIDMNDFSLQNVAYLYGADSSDYIRMGITNRLIINVTGGGSPFSTPDIDITGSSYFDDDMGFPLDKKILFGDTGVYIFSDDDGHLDLMADVSIDFNTIADTDLVLNFFGTTNSGVIRWMENEDYFKFDDDIMLLGGENIILSATTGTKIGTATTQLLGFYNATPVDQPATVSDPSGGLVIDAEARTAVIAIIDRLQELGLIA